MPLEALIAEDEDLLRQSLVEQLGRLWPDLALVAECEDGASALEQLAEKQPDIAFLDIRMPGISGIEVARSLSELSPRTQVVFVTAYDQYAIDAFEQGAMDYLLKPVSDERLLATRERILSRLPSTRQDDAVLERLLQRLGPSQGAA
ncbi:LytR/AlgR family response regulator transcription factor, partial [Stenotrophomonas maltophilia]